MRALPFCMKYAPPLHYITFCNQFYRISFRRPSQNYTLQYMHIFCSESMQKHKCKQSKRNIKIGRRKNKRFYL